MTVFLVGAGPGDPGLLTVRGAEVLATADVVVYDRLLAESLLDLAPKHCEFISVAKRAGEATMPQDDINQLLVERGRDGQQVVRLKGGDPFVFARGGEEAAALAKAGIEFEIIPGVTSAIAVPAYAGIPVTLRHSSTSFTVITGHEDPDKGGEIDWDAVAKLGGTIVILMGVGRIKKIVDRLLAGGLPGDTPAAAIRWGTRADQQTVRATLETIAFADLESPSVIVIGYVASLDLAWFETRPLFGTKVVVTRPKHQISKLSEALRAQGAQPILVPTIEITEPADGGTARRQAAQNLHDYEWIVFTSANGVEKFCAEVRDSRAFAASQIAVIGPGTAEALARYSLVPDVIPDRFIAESLLEALPLPTATAKKVLLARAEVARDVLPDGLRRLGWEVDVVDCYKTIPVVPSERQREMVRNADIVTFTSSSTVENWVAAFGTEVVPPTVACIGPVTADTARRLGLGVDIIAEQHTIDGLVAALVDRVGTRTAPKKKKR